MYPHSIFCEKIFFFKDSKKSLDNAWASFHNARFVKQEARNIMLTSTSSSNFLVQAVLLLWFYLFYVLVFIFCAHTAYDMFSLIVNLVCPT